MVTTVDNTLDLIVSQHQKPKFIEWVKVKLELYQNIIDVENEMKQAFNLNTAVGKQLDIIGEILDLPRTVNFQPSDGSSPVLNDYYYRIILKCKVIKNQWKGTVTNFYEYWTALFTGIPLDIYLIDNQDMEPVIVIWSSLVDPMIEDLLTHYYIIPKPAGIGFGIERIDPDTIFGFEDTGFQPFDQGVFYE